MIRDMAAQPARTARSSAQARADESRHEPGPWQKEAGDFTRAFSGAFLFGIPLLYTMEMWWIGVTLDSWRLVGILVVGFLANLALTHVTGFKRESSFGTNLNQAIDAMAVGVVGSVVVLLVLNRISYGDPLGAILGKIVVQMLPLSIGASLANAVFSSGSREGDDVPATDPLKATLGDLGATMIGSVFIGFNIAPTEEVAMLATQMTYWHEVALVGLSLVVTYGIVFASGFDPQKSKPGTFAIFQHPITETVAAYVVSLLVAAAALYLLGRIGAEDPLAFAVSQTLVLGLPAAVGGAAGRLAV